MNNSRSTKNFCRYVLSNPVRKFKQIGRNVQDKLMFYFT